MFDHEQNQTVDRREVGAILRSLGKMHYLKLMIQVASINCFGYFQKGFCPSESELQEVLRDMEDPKHVGIIHMDRYLPVVTKLVAKQR